jgi:hypothetical protein
MSALNVIGDEIREFHSQFPVLTAIERVGFSAADVAYSGDTGRRGDPVLSSFRMSKCLHVQRLKDGRPRASARACGELRGRNSRSGPARERGGEENVSLVHNGTMDTWKEKGESKPRFNWARLTNSSSGRRQRQQTPSRNKRGLQPEETTVEAT